MLPAAAAAIYILEVQKGAIMSKDRKRRQQFDNMGQVVARIRLDQESSFMACSSPSRGYLSSTSRKLNFLHSVSISLP